MAKKGIRAGNSYKTQYKAYKISGRWFKNKERKLLARLARNENDKGAEKSLELLTKGNRQPKRGRPKGKGWFHPQETSILKKLKSDRITILETIELKTQLDKIKDTYHNTRASAIAHTKPYIEEDNTIADSYII